MRLLLPLNPPDEDILEHDKVTGKAVPGVLESSRAVFFKNIMPHPGEAIAHQIEQGNITDRKGVIEALEGAGLEITRQTDKSINHTNQNQ